MGKAARSPEQRTDGSTTLVIVLGRLQSHFPPKGCATCSLAWLPISIGWSRPADDCAYAHSRIATLFVARPSRLALGRGNRSSSLHDEESFVVAVDGWSRLHAYIWY